MKAAKVVNVLWVAALIAAGMGIFFSIIVEAIFSSETAGKITFWVVFVLVFALLLFFNGAPASEEEPIKMPSKEAG